MLPIASATRTAKLTADEKGVAKKVAFKCEVTDTLTVSDGDMPTAVIRCSDLQPGQKLKGHIGDMHTGEMRGGTRRRNVCTSCRGARLS